MATKKKAAKKTATKKPVKKAAKTAARPASKKAVKKAVKKAPAKKAAPAKKTAKKAAPKSASKKSVRKQMAPPPAAPSAGRDGLDASPYNHGQRRNVADRAAVRLPGDANRGSGGLARIGQVRISSTDGNGRAILGRHPQIAGGRRNGPDRSRSCVPDAALSAPPARGPSARPCAPRAARSSSPTRSAARGAPARSTRRRGSPGWRRSTTGAGAPTARAWSCSATAIAVADEAAAAADLARVRQGLRPPRPVVVRGLQRYITEADGPGVAAPSCRQARRGPLPPGSDVRVDAHGGCRPRAERTWTRSQSWLTIHIPVAADRVARRAHAADERVGDRRDLRRTPRTV